MQLGILTAPFPDTPLEDVAAWAATEGFQSLEIACWPSAGGEKRRYAGTSHLPIEDMTPSRASEILGMLADHGLSVSALGYYPNPLHADAAVRDAVATHITRIITAAQRMGVGVVNTFMGGDRTLSVDQNWTRAVEILTPLVDHARDHGVTLAFENCPMIFSQDEWPGGHNIAYAPRIWRRIFETWGEGVGMNYDPSHLVWQMIDAGRFVREFGAQMVHVHAKDLMIDRDGLYDHGILSAGMGWQVPRMPGLGEVDWPDFFASLYRAGYDGPIIIEHEDRTFEGSDARIKRGFALARDVLRPFIK